MKVLIFGTFDKLHPGHEFVLRAAADRGEVSVVVARDETVEKIKGNLPKHNQEERQEAIQNAFPDMEVVLGNPADFIAPVRSINPDLILLGYDQKMPPGVTESDLPCPVERLDAFQPDQYKSSLKD